MLVPLASRAAAVLLASSSLALAQWIQRTPASAPTARTGAAMAFDPNSAGLILFGGSAPLVSNQTWAYDGTAWTLLAPAAAPTARFGAQLVHDVARGVMVLYGGLATNISVPPPNSDTWEWDGVTWTQAAPTANAGPRYQYGACYDLVRQRTVIYGGATSQLLIPPSNQTWEYDGVTWTQVTTTGNPGPRNRPAMCYHFGQNRTVMFGGFDGTNLTDSTWFYDGSTWTQASVTGSKPSPRNAASMVYDEERDVCVLMGGQDATGPLADTWTFDGTKWQQQPFPTQPVRDHAMAFDPIGRQVVKFGGFTAAPNTLSDQTWEFGTGIYGYGCPGSNGVPAMVATGPARLAQPWTLDLTNLNPAISLGVIALGFSRLPNLDLTFVLDMPGCFAFATPDVLVDFLGPGSTASWSWPSVAGLIGDSFYGQALCFDPGVNGFGFTVSNAVFTTITF
ncbi:MAG: hypothetical protein KF830_17035 [Planctomycetes bacterium]|nr:hypothetical protein [Planctomycetota bacterium]